MENDVLVLSQPYHMIYENNRVYIDLTDEVKPKHHIDTVKILQIHQMKLAEEKRRNLTREYWSKAKENRIKQEVEEEQQVEQQVEEEEESEEEQVEEEEESEEEQVEQVEQVENQVENQVEHTLTLKEATLPFTPDVAYEDDDYPTLPPTPPTPQEQMEPMDVEEDDEDGEDPIDPDFERELLDFFQDVRHTAKEIGQEVTRQMDSLPKNPPTVHKTHADLVEERRQLQEMDTFPHSRPTVGFKTPRGITKSRPRGRGMMKKSGRPRFKSGTVALREIRHYQKTTDLLLKKAPFIRLVRQTMKELFPEGDFKITKEAFRALQEICETMLTNLFEKAQRAAIHAKRITISQRDIQLVQWMHQP